MTLMDEENNKKTNLKLLDPDSGGRVPLNAQVIDPRGAA